MEDAILNRTREYLSKVIPDFKELKKGLTFFFTCPKCGYEEPTCHYMTPSNPTLYCSRCSQIENNAGRLGNIVELFGKIKNLTKEQVISDMISKLGIEVPNQALLKNVLDFFENQSFDLVPIARYGKAPIEKEWPLKTHKDRQEWSEWLEEKLNIGVKTGVKSNITVVDIDTNTIPPEFDSIKGDTLSQKTKNGFHFFYLYEEDLPSTRIEDLKIDILNNGKQCVLYPSEVEGYKRAFTSELKIIKMPEAVKEFIKKRVGKNPLPRSNSEILREDIKTCNFNYDVIKEGNRNNFMIRLGGILRKEMNLSQVSYALDVINKHFCNPPLNERDFKALIGQIDKYVTNDLSDATTKVGNYLKLVGEATSKDIQEVLGEKKVIVDKILAYLMKENLVVRKGRLYQAIKKVEWLDTFPIFNPEVKFKVPYFHDKAHFNFGDMILLGGQSKTGKTTIAMNFIKQLVDQGIKPHYMYLETGCFDEQTEILTNNGWKTHDTIKQEDMVLSLNPMEGFSVYKPISHIFTEDYNGKMFSYKNDAVDFKVTPNHKIYYRSEYEDFYELDEIREVLKTNSSIRFKTNFSLRDTHARVLTIKIGDKEYNRTALMKFLGWFISEGNLTNINLYSTRRSSWQLQITQRKETYKKELLKMFSELGFSPKISKSNEIYTINDKELYLWIKKYCYHPELKRARNSYVKYIPEIVMESCSKDIAAFLDCYIMGDGHYRVRKDGTRVNCISTAQKQLADSLQLLMLKLGKSTSLKFYPNSTSGLYRVKEIIENEVQVKKKKIKEEHYEGKIWCVETRPYHLIFARRNGYCYWSGNSRFLKSCRALGLTEGQFHHAFVSDPTKVEFEPNSVTILDWLLIQDKAQTDSVMKYFVEQLHKTQGFLIAFMQLKKDNSWFAPNMIEQFPSLAARYIYDQVDVGYGTTGAWYLDVIREAKAKVKKDIIPCKYDWDSRLLLPLSEENNSSGGVF